MSVGAVQLERARRIRETREAQRQSQAIEEEFAREPPQLPESPTVIERLRGRRRTAAEKEQIKDVTRAKRKRTETLMQSPLIQSLEQQIRAERQARRESFAKTRLGVIDSLSARTRRETRAQRREAAKRLPRQDIIETGVQAAAFAGTAPFDITKAVIERGARPEERIFIQSQLGKDTAKARAAGGVEGVAKETASFLTGQTKGSSFLPGIGKGQREGTREFLEGTRLTPGQKKFAERTSMKERGSVAGAFFASSLAISTGSEVIGGAKAGIKLLKLGKAGPVKRGVVAGIEIAKAGAFEGAGTAGIFTKSILKREPSTKEVAAGTGLGAVTAGVVGGTIVGLSKDAPTAARRLLTSARVVDPFEGPGDVLGALVERRVGIPDVSVTTAGVPIIAETASNILSTKTGTSTQITQPLSTREGRGGRVKGKRGGGVPTISDIPELIPTRSKLIPTADTRPVSGVSTATEQPTETPTDTPADTPSDVPVTPPDTTNIFSETTTSTSTSTSTSITTQTPTDTPTQTPTSIITTVPTSFVPIFPGIGGGGDPFGGFGFARRSRGPKARRKPSLLGIDLFRTKGLGTKELGLGTAIGLRPVFTGRPSRTAKKGKKKKGKKGGSSLKGFGFSTGKSKGMKGFTI